MLSTFSAYSVIMLGAVGEPTAVIARFRELVGADFPDAKTYVLVKRISWPLRLVMIAARRKQSPYDLLLRIDLDNEVDTRGKNALERFRAAHSTDGRMLLFQSANHQFHRSGCSPADTAMAFINTWPEHSSKTEARRHWIEEHGPLVQKVGLPDVITSYTQIHFDDTLDQIYQGLSFETITGQWDLVKRFLGSRSLRRLNNILLEDERNFTGPPFFTAFREVK